MNVEYNGECLMNVESIMEKCFDEYREDNGECLMNVERIMENV